LKIDWAKLTEDLKVAKSLAEEALKGEDGGTCNMDYVYIKLPRARGKKVIEVFEAVGLRTSKRNYYGGVHYSVGGIRGGQGNANVRATNAVKKYLVEQGWDVGIIYIMD
jgi:hypothetical protein